MPLLFGKQMTKNEIRERVGDMTQLAGAMPFTYSDGKAKGTAAIEVKNGSGLKFVILPGRGMDIAYAEINGIPISYISKTGIVNPAYYEESDFLRSFYAGLLTTCGLTYMGAPCVDEGVSLGAHGRISNTPAYDVSINSRWVGENYIITVSGKVRESTLFGENLVLTRTIETRLGENKIHIHDEIENCGFDPAPLMVLYHMNFGFPLISEKTTLETNCENLRPRDEDALPGIKDSLTFSNPVQGYKEQVFYRDSVKESFAALVNPDLGLRCEVSFKGEQLPYLVEWKQMGKQEYVVGLEPATYPPDGRAKARERGELLHLAPGEIKVHDIILSAEIK